MDEVKLRLGWGDRIWMWARPHLKAADVEVGKDPVGRPHGWQLVSLLTMAELSSDKTCA